MIDYELIMQMRKRPGNLKHPEIKGCFVRLEDI